jgi:hypothetical protein
MSAEPHGPHEFFPHQWAEAVTCYGWTVQEADAKALTDQMRTCPGGTRLEASPVVLAAVDRLLEPDYPGDVDVIGHRLVRLFGVPLVAAPLGRGEWRLVGGGGPVAEGVVRDG